MDPVVAMECTDTFLRKIVINRFGFRKLTLPINFSLLYLYAGSMWLTSRWQLQIFGGTKRNARRRRYAEHYWSLLELSFRDFWTCCFSKESVRTLFKVSFPGLSVCRTSLINSLKFFMAAVWHSITRTARSLTEQRDHLLNGKITYWTARSLTEQQDHLQRLGLSNLFHFFIIVKRIWNGTWIYQKPVLREKCLHLWISGIPVIRSSRTCVKRNVPAMKKI